LASISRFTRSSPGSRATRSTTRRRRVQITSSTMVCTGFTKKTTGTRVPGTTALGNSWVLRRCRCTSCASRCATTGRLLHTSAAGSGMRRHAGTITGAMTGRRSATVGTGGTVLLHRRQHRCRPTSASIPGIAIPIRWSNNAIFTERTTVTSHVMRWYGSTNRRRRPEWPPRLRSRIGRKRISRIGRGRLSRKPQGHRTPSVPRRLRHPGRKPSLPRARSHNKEAAKRFSGQPQPNPLFNREAW